MNPSTRFDIDKGKSRLLREIVYRVFSRRWRSDADGKLKRSQAVSGEINLPGLDARADQGGDHFIRARRKVDCETAMCAASFPGQAAPVFLSGCVVPAHESVALDEARKPNLFASSEDSIGGQLPSSPCARRLQYKPHFSGDVYRDSTHLTRIHPKSGTPRIAGWPPPRPCRRIN